MAKKRSNKEFHTKLIIYRSRQFTLGMICIILVITFTVAINNGINLGLDWKTIGFPLLITCGFLTVFPPTEEWEYKAWQNKSEQIEQHFEY